jgi:glycerophosphoryl diester phosphodiesterase
MRVIAHRGASAAEPENTLAAFALAKRVGAHAIELDARICGSGEVVVFHDETLERLTGAKGAVAATPLAELRKLRVAGREAIPTLEEILRSEERPHALVIELKTDRWNDVAVALRTVELLSRTQADARGPITVSSFNPLALRTLRALAPHVPRAMLAARANARPLRNLWFTRPVAPRELHLEACLIDARTIARARRAGRFVVAWTVNDAREGARLAALGVDGLITDVPEVFVTRGDPARG